MWGRWCSLVRRVCRMNLLLCGPRLVGLSGDLFTVVSNRSRDSELNELGPLIGSKQISDLPMSVAEGGYYGEEESEKESQEVEVNSHI
jgi:hypothetical protein